jgi:hypothetical protein
MKMLRHLAPLALAFAATAPFAQTTDLSAPARQERMDRALDNYNRKHPDAPVATGTDASTPRAATKSDGRSIGSDFRQFGRSFVQDAKQAPHTMAKAGRDTGHAVANAARQTGKDAKETAKKAKDAVTN